MRTELIKKLTEMIVERGIEQVFFTRNTMDDSVETIFCEGEIFLDICNQYGYAEVLGLSDEERLLLKNEIYKYHDKENAI